MRIHHVAMRTADLGRLERFYVDVLGMATRKRDDTRGTVWLDAGQAVLMLERAAATEPPVQQGANELLAFAVDDLVAWRIRLEGAGVAIEAHTPHTLYFRDPDGRRIAVSNHPLDEST